MYGSKYVNNQSMHGSKYVTNTPTWERCWLQSSSVHPNDENQETHWLQNLCRKDAATFIREYDEIGQILLSVTICMYNQFALSCIIWNDLENNPYICLGLEKRNPTQITWICVKNISENLNFVILDKYCFCCVVVEIPY